LDDYTGSIILEVSDGDSIATDTAEVTVINVPPIINSTDGPTEVELGTEVPIVVNFFDGLPDPRGFIASLDTYTATFYWNDGTSTELLLGVGEFWANASHMYTESGVYDIIITIVDDNGGEVSAVWEVMVIMKLVEAGPDGLIDEGSLFISAGYLADDSGEYTALVNYGDGTGDQSLLLNPGNTFDLQHHYCDNGINTVLVTVFNGNEEWGSDSVVVTVNNVAPTIISLSGPPTDPALLGTPINLDGVFSDPGCLDTHEATIDWGDGQTTSSSIPLGIYLISGIHTYASAGVYQITLTVTDKDGGSDTMTLSYYVVIYDNTAGKKVTGGGWIIAPAGSYPADPNMSGRCNFGFVSKLKKGDSIPTGNTEFQFHPADLNFHSHTYEWLVVAGSIAMYKGTGTINGEGNYGFIVTVVDSQISGGGGVDTFRIKIWDKNNGDLIVFDSGSIELSGGQITIHKS
jgi:PKD repeat protein